MPLSPGTHLIKDTPEEPAMNVLGKSVYRTLRETVGDPRRMVVIHDSINLTACEVKVTDKVSPEGHRGVRSVNHAVYAGQAERYYRLHIGIGRDDSVPQRDFVLGPLNSYEKKHFSANGAGIDDVWSLIEEAALRGDEFRKHSSMKHPLP